MEYLTPWQYQNLVGELVSDVFRFFNCNLKLNEVMVLRLSDGYILTLSQINAMGGECNDCCCDYYRDKTTRVLNQVVIAFMPSDVTGNIPET